MPLTPVPKNEVVRSMLKMIAERDEAPTYLELCERLDKLPGGEMDAFDILFNASIEVEHLLGVEYT